MSTDAIEIRPATVQDAYALWIWANDEQTRIASFNRPLIPWADHTRWLARALGDPGQLHLIAEVQGGRPAGSIRFDSKDSWETARLSYLVAPEARGGGLSQVIINGGVEWVRRWKPAVSIWAIVMRSNLRSLRVFRKAGWQETEEADNASAFWLKREEAK